MINYAIKFLSLVFLFSCVSNATDSSVKVDSIPIELYRSVFGYDTSSISKEIYDEYSFSFIQARIGRGPQAIFVLSKIDSNLFYWIGSNDEKIVTSNGKIIMTEGLERNVVARGYEPFQENFRQFFSKDLYNPDAINLNVISEIECNESKITYLEVIEETTKCVETEKHTDIEQTFKNIYQYNNKKRPIYTEQKFHPFEPKIYLSFYYK